jgi:uncharacterized protein (DUF58 family)
MRRRAPARRRATRWSALGVALAGVAALVAARGFGTPALAPFGAGLLVLPLLSVALVHMAARALRVERHVSPLLMRAGEPATAHVLVTGWPARLGLLEVLTWSVEPGLGTAGRALADPARAVPGGREQAWRLPSVRRGEHRLEPPVVTLADPFGLSLRRVRGHGPGGLLALPRLVPVARPFWERGAGGRAGVAALRRRGGHELAGVRDYAPGDPPAWVHWGQSAKRGRLQVRDMLGADVRGQRLVVLLDAAAGPGGRGDHDPEFETAVSAAASLAAHLGGRGDDLIVVHTGARRGRAPAGRGAGDGADRALARVARDGGEPLASALRTLARETPMPRVIAVITAAPVGDLVRAVRGATGAGVTVACVLVGDAAADSGALAAAGAKVARVPAASGLAEALSGA